MCKLILVFISVFVNFLFSFFFVHFIMFYYYYLKVLSRVSMLCMQSAILFSKSVVRPSVCLSTAGILYKRMDVLSNFLTF